VWVPPRLELENPPLVAALGRAQLHRPPTPLSQRSGQGVVLTRFALHDDLRRDRGGAAVVLEHELLGHLGQTALGLVGQVEGLPVGQHPVSHLEDLCVGVHAVDGDGHRIQGADRLVGHPLALEQRAHRAQPVALQRRLLELLRLGGRVHALLEVALDVAIAPGEEVDHAVDAPAVFLTRHVAHAGGLAALDVVVQAG
jgi:hypothetical protein